MAFKVCILVVSDTCFEDPSADKVIPRLKDVISDNSSAGFEMESVHIVPDDIDKIQEKVGQWIDQEQSLILTAGGTGFSDKDHTPEAIAPLLSRQAPGIVHGMLSSSLEITPFAIMARPVAGTAKKSLIITLPGSPKGAAENLSAVIGILPHALMQIAGDDSRKIHARQATIPLEHSHHHHNHHHHHSHSHSHSHGPKSHLTIQPRTLTTIPQRDRKSPYPMISVEEALNLIHKYAPLPRIEEKHVSDPLIGYILAENVYAPANVPGYRASIVDGYALNHAQGPGIYPVSLVSHAAAHSNSASLAEGSAARITTGAPVPVGATAVVMVEETVLISMTDDGKEEKEVEILATGVQEGDNIREIGSDVRKGDCVLKAGTRISSSGGEIGLLYSLGIRRVKVFAKPIVCVLSTGDEVVDVVDRPNDYQLLPGEIWDSNRPTLISTINAWGYQAKDLGIASDTAEELQRQISHFQASDGMDVLITTGGVSMGELDLLKPTIRLLNGTIHFGRVAMKPGKPTTFATIKDMSSDKQEHTKLIFALPGNPASASVTFHLFVLPALRQLAGLCTYTNSNQNLINGPLPSLPIVEVVLQHSVKLDPRPEYHRVHVKQKRLGDGSTILAASTTGFQRSSRIGSLQGANGLLILPSSQDSPETVLKENSKVSAILIDQLEGGP